MSSATSWEAAHSEAALRRAASARSSRGKAAPPPSAAAAPAPPRPPPPPSPPPSSVRSGRRLPHSRMTCSDLPVVSTIAACGSRNAGT